MNLAVLPFVLFWTHCSTQENHSQSVEKQTSRVQCYENNPSVLIKPDRKAETLQADHTVNVTLRDVIPGTPVLFRACPFLPTAVPDDHCQPLFSKQSFSETTGTTEHEIEVYIPPSLPCKFCILEYRLIQDNRNFDHRSGGKKQFQRCVLFLLSEGRRKRQADGCQGTGLYVDLPGIDGWCQLNCAVGYCPGSHCTCTDQAYPAYEYEAETKAENPEEEIVVEITSKV